MRGLGQLFRSKRICTVGDLSSLSEYDINNLPVRVPKVPTVIAALSALETKIKQKKITGKYLVVFLYIQVFVVMDYMDSLC